MEFAKNFYENLSMNIIKTETSKISAKMLVPRHSPKRPNLQHSVEHNVTYMQNVVIEGVSHAYSHYAECDQ